MSNGRPIYWLHLSDLHFGARGKEVLHQATTEFFQGLGNLLEIVPTAPDLILLSGDVAFSGKPEEYDQADAFLDELWKVLNTAYGGCDPILICVPGNHDIIRPMLSEALRYDVFNRYAESTDEDLSVRCLNELLWDKQDADILRSLFPHYMAWASKRMEALRKRAGVRVHTSDIPGDLCVELNLSGTFPLCIVGLNSAWLQYSDANFEGKLSLPTRQFQAVLPHADVSNPLDLFKRYRRALLMLHHPPSWLSAKAQNLFCSEVFLPDRFGMCLYGHMHAGRAKQTAISGGSPRYEFQSPSLCGLSHYGKAKEERAFGFSLGCLTYDGEIRVWPYKRVPLAGGEHAFFWDQSFGMEHPEGILLRPRDSSELKPQILKTSPVLVTSTTATEGAVLRIVLVNFQRAEQQRLAVIEFLNSQFNEVAQSVPVTERLEWIDCSWDGEFTLFLSRFKDQSWSTLLEKALQIAFHIASAIKQHSDKLGNHEWTPQAGIAIHVEHDGHRLQLSPGSQAGSQIVGEGIDYARSMLPKPARAYILLSGDAYRYLRRFLSDCRAIGRLLNETPLGPVTEESVRADIGKLTMAPQQQSTDTAEHVEYWELYEIYNLCLRSRHGELLLGDTHVPPNRFRIDHSRPSDEQAFIERLVNAERVCIIGVTNEHLVQYLHKASQERQKQVRGFWEEIRVVFLARELLPAVLDQRCQRFDFVKAIEDRLDGWGRGVREVREFFLSLGAEVGRKWECLQFNYVLPFEAQRYNDGEDSLVRVVPILPNADVQKSYCIEATTGSLLHTQLSNAIDAILRTATPIVEFNVYGHADAKAKFSLAGVVSQRDWRRFKPPEGGNPCFPVSFILLHTDVGGVQSVLLQNRTVFNTGGDFDLFSLISGKVNDEDFFFPDLPSDQYRRLAYQVSSSGEDNMRQKLSRMFARERNLVIRQPIPPDVMKGVWEKTAIRELNAELGLRIEPDRLVPYPDPFLLDRDEGFKLYIQLYTLELQPEERAQIQRVRPHANLERFTLERLIECKEKQKLSVFLCAKLDEYILPLVRDSLGVR